MGTPTVTFAQRVQVLRHRLLGTTPAILRTFLDLKRDTDVSVVVYYLRTHGNRAVPLRLVKPLQILHAFSHKLLAITTAREEMSLLYRDM